MLKHIPFLRVILFIVSTHRRFCVKAKRFSFSVAAILPFSQKKQNYFPSKRRGSTTLAFIPPRSIFLKRSRVDRNVDSNEYSYRKEPPTTHTPSISSLSSSSSSISNEIRYIAGRRALLIYPPSEFPSTSPSSPDSSSSSSIPEYPPLVILGGMAQSISSWEFHLPSLSRHRMVLVYEALGQGPPPSSEVCSIDDEIDGSKSEVTLDQYYDDVSLERQGRDFWEVVEEAFFGPDSYHSSAHSKSSDNDRILDFPEKPKIDVAGFSFGGRVAMAAASLQPNRIRRLYLTGVSAERDPLANVILASWKEILGVNAINIADGSDKNSNRYDRGIESYYEEECDPEIHASRCTARLRSFAWSIILQTYSEKFLAKSGPNRVQAWVDGVCRYNTEEGLRALLMQTHGHFMDETDSEDSLDPWTPAAMARRISETQSIEQCKIVVGSEDKMSSPEQALRLAILLGLSTEINASDYKTHGIVCSFKVMEGCGHAVPMEAMRLWREDLLSFLN